MAPLDANFASSRRMECSTNSAGERLKCVRPSLSNSATSLACIVVAMKTPQEGQTTITNDKHIIVPQKRSRCQMRENVWVWIGCARDPFDFAQGRLFPPPEKRLRSG